MKFDITTVRSAVEFGFKGHENGHNLEKVLSDFDELMKSWGLVLDEIRKTN